MTPPVLTADAAAAVVVVATAIAISTDLPVLPNIVGLTVDVPTPVLTATLAPQATKPTQPLPINKAATPAIAPDASGHQINTMIKLVKLFVNVILL